MSSSQWAKRRKLMYTSIAVGVLSVVFGVQGFRAFYEPPTCFDGRKNGGETGVDCGGPCARICSVDVKPLSLQWVKHFKIRDGEYSVVAHIENPNGNAGVLELPYVFRLIDRFGNVLTEVDGTSYAEPNESFPIFEGPLYLTDEPARAEFEFSREPVYVKQIPEEKKLIIENSTLLSSETAPKISTLVQNTSISAISDIVALAVVYDGADNPVAVSKTDVNYLSPNSRERITFTWPDPFKIEPGVCEQPVNTILAIDRSGSMNDDGDNPPQPITDVLRAASSFVSNLRQEDKIGVVSYATQASNPIDIFPTLDKSAAEDVLSDITISLADETSYTNPGDAIIRARNALVADTSFNIGNRESILILLTDGYANYPQDPGGEEYAEREASETKRSGIKIYTIGLGENINRQFLGRIATAPEYYFEAATKEDLAGIYEEIGTAVCSLGPSIIEITPRYNIFNASANR
jgi:Mg-chelatase subunit ChlD